MSGEFDKIIEVAKYQQGYFGTFQVDVSPQLLKHHENAGRLERLRRGIYRVTQYPMGEDEEYIVAYLWSKEKGTLSHQTALALHDLSDVLPDKVHITLPPDEKPVRRQVPE
jgi:predicted transcriptional regulator of viral defense system